MFSMKAALSGYTRRGEISGSVSDHSNRQDTDKRPVAWVLNMSCDTAQDRLDMRQWTDQHPSGF